jgi:Kazal-type serine protease inhibitor domain
MNSSSMALVLASVSVFALSGCAGNSSDGTQLSAEASEDSSDEVLDEAASDLTAASNFGYFVVTRRDARRCASPMCGGYFVKRVNQTTTRCADGSLQAECYVSGFTFTSLKLDANEEASFLDRLTAGFGLAKATMRYQTVSGSRIGKLSVTEAWDAAADVKPTGSFYRIADSGRRCIVAPCYSIDATQLNTNGVKHTVRSTNLENVNADQAKLDAAGLAIMSTEGVLAAGGVALPKCRPNANCGPFFSPENFYLRVQHQPLAVGKICGGRTPSPCNANEYCAYPQGALCGRADATGRCATKPDACIQVFQPVCGCNGQTYGNACDAASNGVSVEFNRACQ